MPRRPKPRPRGLEPLTPLELTLMRIIWDRENATAAEVAQALDGPRRLADTTIHTVLANLRKKGYVEPIPTIERSLRFAPRVPREQVGGRSLRQLMSDFFGGSPPRLMAHLLQDENIEERDLAEIRKLLSREKRKDGGRDQ